MDENIRDFDPKNGMAFQGDVSIIPIPADIPINRLDEIAPIKGRLILQEGEISGHHHAIDVLARSAAIGGLIDDALKHKIPLPSARLFRDETAVAKMVERGVLTRSDLVIGVLVIEIGPMCLRHEEHTAIRIPPGNYFIGRQVESAEAEERRVID